MPTSNTTDSFSILDLFYVKIKFLNERNCSKKRYGTKSAAAGCKQAANDDDRCQSFALLLFFFFQYLHESFDNIDAITFFKPVSYTHLTLPTSDLV